MMAADIYASDITSIFDNPKIDKYNICITILQSHYFLQAVK